ncbi:hypothetical protein COCNU_16G007700 [Cocos nucifera]|uniref:SAWADEE domain-containing protein n=1 Tax=Cocos nucifera TaxID=13894 RepID=A0A8K0NES6_COCNU|nr:hypothetical protein COCNU_16G007700 [Cocos nucifera]
MAAMSAESMELEAMRKEDGSWHPCRVSLSSNDANSVIAVQFESCNQEDIISDREDALARLRFRSTPLEYGECSHIKEGECVLVMHKGRTTSLFFDAVIEKTYRVKHSNRVHCRCTFEVKWLNPKLNGETVTVPSKSVMKLSDKDIDSHPVFAAFLTTLTRRNGVEFPSFLDLLEETTRETNLHGLLEKQIEEISKSADESECLRDVLLEGKRANLNGRKWNKVVVTSRTILFNGHDDFRRSTRSQSKQQLDIELNKRLKDAPLSPLAARAALASLVHELPHEPEFPICQMEKEGHLDPAPEGLKKHIDEPFVDVEGLLDISDVKIRSCISTRRNSMKKLVSEESPDSLSSQEKPAGASKESGKKVGSSTIVKRSKNSGTDGKPNGGTVTTRLTRSAIQKDILNSTVEVEQGSLNGKFASLVSTRLTHSAEQGMRCVANIKQKLGNNNLSQGAEEFVTPENIESKKKKIPPVGRETNLTLDSRKRTRASSVTAPTKEDQGEILQDNESDPASKRKASSRKPSLRFSPRLRFLPRTRSQKKGSAAH